MLSGDDMRLFGSSARSDVDKAEPSFLVKIEKQAKELEYLCIVISHEGAIWKISKYFVRNCTGASPVGEKQAKELEYLCVVISHERENWSIAKRFA